MNKPQEQIESIQALAYRRSVVSRLHSWIRIVFFVEVCVSAMGFFFFPFRETDIVERFEPYDRTDHYQHLRTKGGRSFMLNNDRLKNTQLAAGDTIFLEKNLFYKTEAICVPAVHDSFFPASKMTWLYIQAIFMGAAIASFYFSIPKDLPIKQGLSVLLEIICVLYLFI